MTEAQSHEEQPTPREEQNVAMALQIKNMEAEIKALKESVITSEQAQK